MSQNYLENILSELDKDSKLVYIIKSLAKDNNIDNFLLNSISELIKQEIQKTNSGIEKSKLQRSLNYIEQIRQEEKVEESSTDIDLELENQLYDL